ncbi:phosphoribosylanthranilate isomerase [Chroococcidiopsis sp. CCMEE 29]|uniref:phosphoribosylanthranilate isomerase n=1 Tax=Chroococcidiopsis sp. CCMEE 29 TaxID=155894 RepID=UPI00202028C5|nr:phosphoribosylanthranilate isomerase [Chroococcidiopsis sp. CCMEE 29]
MRVKICGITKPEQGKVIASFGATALGFICVPSSPRYVNSIQIQAVVEQLPATVDRIGVFAGATTEEICQVVVATGLTGVQLHGEETPAACHQLRSMLSNVEIIKALRIRNLQALEQAANYAACVDTLLVDAYHPQILGGTGKTLDWEALQQFQPSLPWLLAGGLTPDNILDALGQLRPHGIDLSSGVERAPGDKDLDKVAQLFEQLRQRQLVNGEC